MVVFIVIGGESQCELFAQMCLLADYLVKQLPEFCYQRIEKSVLDWATWLSKINVKNEWNHIGSPIVWKELLMKGSKPFYIGGAPEFMEYIHTYYNFDLFMGIERYAPLVNIVAQYKKKLKAEALETMDKEFTEKLAVMEKDTFVVTITGTSYPLSMYVISRLLDMGVGERSVSKIFIYDEDCSPEFMEGIEAQCSYIGTKYPGRVVKYVDKIGNALTVTDLLIVLDHVPFNPTKSIGEWLGANMRLMQGLAFMINASASRSMYVIFANLGPACFNATVLMNAVTINVKNIVVVTSDLGVECTTSLSEVTGIPVRQMFCPPVWGFVGINHLVDVHTTVHTYNSFEPYKRHTRVRDSSMRIGIVTPEVRVFQYLTYEKDQSVWLKVAEKKSKIPADSTSLAKCVTLMNLIKIWLLDASPPDYIINLGILCDGTFGLTFKGAFSQPCRLHGREWRPAKEFFMPRDTYMKLPYMQSIAEKMMTLGKKDLPPIVPLYPCSCKKKQVQKREVW